MLFFVCGHKVFVCSFSYHICCNISTLVAASDRFLAQIKIRFWGVGVGTGERCADTCCWSEPTVSRSAEVNLSEASLSFHRRPKISCPVTTCRWAAFPLNVRETFFLFEIFLWYPQIYIESSVKMKMWYSFVSSACSSKTGMMFLFPVSTGWSNGSEEVKNDESSGLRFWKRDNYYIF